MKKKILIVCTIVISIAVGFIFGRLHTIYTAKPTIISEHEVYIDYGTRVDSYYCE